MADSGCQSMLSGLRLLHMIGLDKRDLMPVTLRMKTATDGDVKIIGAVILQLSGRDGKGLLRSTRQMCYITDSGDKLYLNREGMLDLGIISSDFPSIGESALDHVVNAAMTISVICSCPARSEPPPLPTSLPAGLIATEKNREALECWIRDRYASSTFNTCEHQPLPLMKGEPLILHMDPTAKPVAQHTPAPVPIHWQAQVKADLDRDVRLGIIEQVPTNTPVTWCSRMVLAAKHNGLPRRTVDLQPQNRHAARQTHHTMSPFHQAELVPHHTTKTVCDAWNGYHQVPLRPEDRHYTTFITPWGRYRYRVAPQGFLASGDGYTQRFDTIIADFPDKTKCVDDTLLWSTDIESSFFRTCQWLDLCGRNGITLNPEKFVFAQDTVEFAGLEITPTNIRPSKKFLEAISGFPLRRLISLARDHGLG